MQSPGGTMYHHAPALGAPESKPVSSIVPHEMCVGSPSPRNDSEASARIATATISTVLAKISGATLGKMWRDDVEVGGAQRPRALDERALLQGQHLRAHDPPGACPAREPDHHHEHEQRRVEQPREDDHQRELRDHEEPVLERVEQLVVVPPK